MDRRTTARREYESDILSGIRAATAQPLQEQLDPYAERILEAARELLMAHGLRRTSLADIARAAGVSDATLYRRFANRDELLSRLVAREAQQFISRLDEAVGHVTPAQERLVQAFVLFVRSLRDHDLVQRLLVTDPELVLPLLTTDGNAALTLGRQYILDNAHQAERAGMQMTADPDSVAEVLVRLAHSLVLTPQTVLPVDDEQELAELARAMLVPLVFAPAPDGNPADA